MANRHDQQFIYHCPPAAPAKPPAGKSALALIGQTVFAATMLIAAVYLGLPLLALLLQLAESFWYPHSYRSHW